MTTIQTVSHQFIDHVRSLLVRAIDEQEKTARQGPIRPTDLAVPAYLAAAAAMEAHVNEKYLSHLLSVDKNPAWRPVEFP